jgi:glycerophosphoryl diester phosphodiesterase
LKQLVAHRGASAYAPEHTLASYKLAIRQGADYVEQDLAVTRDHALICLHDDSLERTTNAAAVFPDRGVTDPQTGEKRWMAIDFTLAEIKQLDAGSWFDPTFAGERVPTWEEAIATVGAAAGLYPELKTPALYRARSIDQTALFVESVARLRLDSRAPGSIVVQSFDDRTLRDVARQLPQLPRVLLIEPEDGDRWLSREGLAEIASFATGIAPSKRLLDGRPEIMKQAHAAGLTVTAWTFTTRAYEKAAPRFANVTEEMRYFLFELDVDALFTDNPDRFPR